MQKDIVLELQEGYYADLFHHLGVNKYRHNMLMTNLQTNAMRTWFSSCCVLVVFHYMRENNILVSCYWVI